MTVPTDLRRAAGEEALDELVGPGATEVVRDGAALLLRRGPVLVRVRRAPEGEAVARREVDLARLLAERGVPVTALAAPDHPLVGEGCVVTAWSWSAGGAPPTPADLGGLARVLRERTHRLDALRYLPELDPLAAILDALAHLPDDDPDARWLRSRVADLGPAWAEAASEDPLGRAVVHGDLHRGNVVAGPEGPLLTDLELSGVGPSSYDAAPAVVAVDRYGAGPASLDAFLAGFGVDPRGWAGFATFVAVYELWVTAWAVGVRHQDPVWSTEADLRIATLRDAAPHPWTLH